MAEGELPEGLVKIVRGLVSLPQLEAEIKREREEIERLESRLRRYPPPSVIERAYLHRRIEELRRELAEKESARKYPPALSETLAYLMSRECEWVSAREVAEALGISYAAAYSRLRRLLELNLITSHIAWVVRPYIRRRYWHYVKPLYKSHVIVSVVYLGEVKMFEVHEVINHLMPEVPRDLAIRLAKHMLLEYFAVESIEESAFLRSCEFIYGEVETVKVKTFNEETQGLIIDVKTKGKPERRLFKIKWRYERAWVEVKITGERVYHPAKIEYVDIEMLPPIPVEQFEEEWRELKRREMAWT